MRIYILHVLFIAFVFFLTPITHAEESRITLRSSYRDLSVSQVQSMSNITTSRKHSLGFSGYSTINHSYESKSINGDSVVIDNTTGLMWDQSGSSTRMEWDKAKQMVDGLNKRGYAGYHDWRLPTVEEAVSLLESSKKYGLYIDSVFSKEQKKIWTGDEFISEDGAWCVYFRLGEVIWFNVGLFHFVRPVRSVK